jgi:hypothetical protein
VASTLTIRAKALRRPGALGTGALCSIILEDFERVWIENTLFLDPSFI